MERGKRTARAGLGLVHPERELIEACVGALQELLPVQWKLVAAKRAHADQRPSMELRLDGQRVRYFLEARPGLRGEQLGPLVHAAREIEESGGHLLVCGGHVAEKLGRKLREHGVAYMDLAGNAFLRAPGLYVLATGRARRRPVRRRPNLTGTEVRLLGVFLRDLDAGQVVQQELATRAGIALGAVGRGREKLEVLGILERTGKRQWHVRDRAEGLRAFAEGWGAVVRHKLRPRLYRMLDLKGAGNLEQRLKKARRQVDCLLGGERAAGLVTRVLRTDYATLHVPRGHMAAAAKALGLVPDDDGKVTLLERYGQGDEYEMKGVPPLVHPLLIWAECMTVTDERVAQAAKHLHDLLLAGDV